MMILPCILLYHLPVLSKQLSRLLLRAIIDSMKKDCLYIVIPAYNESENIRQVIDDWYPVIKEYGNTASRLMIIDDGSKDDTYKILEECAKSKKQLLPIKKKNSGHGATVLYGYKQALKNRPDFIFQTDSDGQTLPSEFEQFWKLRNEYDMVIGHRRGRKDGFSRIIVTKTLRFVVWLKFHVHVVDANTPFRLMSSKSLSENIRYIPKGFNLSNVILSVLYAKRGQRVKYIPITFRPRQGGVNSINLKKIFGIGKNALVDFGKINKSLKKLDNE